LDSEQYGKLANADFSGSCSERTFKHVVLIIHDHAKVFPVIQEYVRLLLRAQADI
jgi:hypothetical protein